MIPSHLLTGIEQAAKAIGTTWPLYSFVTSNPLSGYENVSFTEALQSAKTLLNANVFPAATLYRQAWESGAIGKKELLLLLKENGLPQSPEAYLSQMEAEERTEQHNATHDVDRMMAKWLAAFMDEGMAEWSMPYKEEGFYKAWRKLAVYDDELGLTPRHKIPKDYLEALAQVLSAYSEEDYVAIFTYHLAALPGWMGYINYRNQTNSPWQQQYPITLAEYLAARLWTAAQRNARIAPEKSAAQANPTHTKLQYLWLKAWETTWQNQLIQTLTKKATAITVTDKDTSTPDAQLVFCIDTRSEAIRNHVEAQGKYETFGYAGFFGIAMEYEEVNDGLLRKSCPPIVPSAYKVSETAQAHCDEKFAAYQKKNDLLTFGRYFLKRMKNILPAAFGYVEGAGWYYALSLVARTLVPGYAYRFKRKNTPAHEGLCEPHIKPHTYQADTLPHIPLKEQVAIVNAAFTLTGWTHFAPLVLFVGHGSHSANNPFASSLDCGACAASPGRHNARMLAKLANLPDVRKALAEEHNLSIPQHTVFVGAEHNTTTDAIDIFDAQVPDSHRARLAQVKSDLLRAQQTATQARLGVAAHSIALAQRKANHWAETRPEWGLAKNAGFIVAPRALTKNHNLHSRCFLHSYNWELDTTGQALEAIMQGPMVVTQWINNHYYFATVDNTTFGAGSKITHNATGKFGVVQGNGGDLKMGLPLQSLYQSDTAMYHQPLRLSVLIQAPVDRVDAILKRNASLKTLLHHAWIYLLVMDPLQHNTILRYQGDGAWVSTQSKGDVAASILST